MKTFLHVVIVIIVVIASGFWYLNLWVSKQFVNLEHSALKVYAFREIESLEQIKQTPELLSLPSQAATQIEAIIQQRLTDLKNEEFLLLYEGRMNRLNSDQIEMFSEIISIAQDSTSFGQMIRDHIIRLRRRILSGISFREYELSIEPDTLTSALYFSADAVLKATDSDFESVEMDDAGGLFSVMALARVSEEIPLVHLSSKSRQILTYHIREAYPWEEFRSDLIAHYKQSGWSHIPVDPYFPFQAFSLEDDLQFSDGYHALWPSLWYNEQMDLLAFVNVTSLTEQAGTVVIFVPNQAISKQIYSDINAYIIESKNTEMQGRQWFYNKNAHSLLTEEKP